MHIPDNYLSPSTCAVFGAFMLPVWRNAIIKVKGEISRKKMPLLGVAAAFSFLVMMFNVPLPGGTTGHAIGGALVAILLGPYAAVLAVTVALVIQALFFGDGGILAIGVNCFNMAFIIPFVSFNLFKMIKRFSKSKKGEYFGAFFSGYIAVNLAALFAAIEFGIQPLLFKDALGKPLYSPYGLTVSIPSMLIPHLLVVGFLEGIITVGAYSYVKKASPEIIYKENNSKNRFLYVILGLLILATPLGLLSSGTAWGEWNVKQIKNLIGFTPKGMKNGFKFNSLFQGYNVGNLKDYIGYILAAVVGVVIILMIFKILEKVKKEKV
ncbi:cobalt/nickel transport system permease protein [Clostridium acetobutylicum]|uniref:Cobalamin biosynthesis protein CbiM n=1 Tax=Clostridium acetobutylicum (strain ATCC 824 / DSM 792 / JCM 1419 / IAM 19013 / LMG 5710 / NBRC 13948 / NRRL B-527 / VKM B-1787 / 2291 / W) TaxID=272562 RepID=Q97KZ5_CLOAB|nr:MULTISPECIES: cobalt transporter CbiM [Clostridium]AAK78747.1 Cobalamin biosynthesis protein CbiM [Clostridium acetobutylicum ATCC 824]ADZ19821.1 cobalt transport protein CbiM [Clostridium acetobutylicum EA 2018]AEI31429.1 cobalt transport protein CbiM [Clostridium acetobutylicum DSM 1731]AWV80465.1 cobalt transporter CbiM [Clostridium acetobutylicum]MBC2392656.1 cobalt transporter CbiM [Clostridium acetobutylicum]